MRRQQIAAWKAARPEVANTRAKAERTAAGRYKEPTLFNCLAKSEDVGKNAPEFIVLESLRDVPNHLCAPIHDGEDRHRSPVREKAPCVILEELLLGVRLEAIGSAECELEKIEECPTHYVIPRFRLSSDQSEEQPTLITRNKFFQLRSGGSSAVMSPRLLSTGVVLAIRFC